MFGRPPSHEVNDDSTGEAGRGAAVTSDCGGRGRATDL